MDAIERAFALNPGPVPPAPDFGDATWPRLGLQLAWVVLAQALATLGCLLFSRPYASVGASRSRAALTADGSAGAQGGAGRRGTAAPEGIELTELSGAAAARAAVVRGLSKMPLDKLAALSPEQLAKRLRKEVEGLVGTEDEGPTDMWFVHALHSVDMLTSLGCVLAWMRKSYVHRVERWIMIAEWAAAAFFLLNYVMRLLRAGLAPAAAASIQGFVDLLTAIPLALQGGPYSTWISFSFLRALCSLWAYEALEASGALDSLSDTRRRAVVVGLRFMALIVCFAGLLFTLEALGDIAGLNDIFIDADMGAISFYQMCYFIFVTISTVGYGDFAPKTVLGRAFVGVVITGGVAFFSVETSALVNLAATEASGRGAFKRRRRGRHVLVAGGAVAAGGTTLTEFLDEMCAPGRGTGARGVPHCVVATPREPSPALRELLRRPTLRRHVTFLAASLLDAGDLARCRAADASAAFVLADLGAADPSGEDEEAVLAAVALHRACPRVPLTLLVNGSAACALAAAAGLPDGCCVAADALAPALLALAARAPGAATLAANLLRTAPPAPPRQQHRPWHDEYLHGLSAGLHGARLGAGAAAAAKTYGALAAEAHAQHGVTLLAMAEASGALQVNPADGVALQPGCFLWGIADSPAALTRAVTRGADDEEEAEFDDWRQGYHASRAAARAALESARGASLQLDAQAARWGATVAGAARNARAAQVDSHALSANAVALASEEDEAGEFSAIAAVNAVAEAGGHVVVINSGGDAWARCEGVVAPLRRAFLPASPPLVLLSPAPPPRGLLRRHTRLLAVRGTAQDAEAMLRAGVDTAARVVYLAGAPTADGGGDDDGSGGSGALDRRAVLSTNILERHHEDWQRDVFLTVELRAPASVKYLQEAVPQPQREAAAAAAAAAEAGAEPSSARARGPLGALGALGALELRELRELRQLLSKGLLSGQGALNALLGTELALLGPDGGLLAEALPPVRASAVLHARFAAGRAFFASDVCRAAAAEYYAPGALAVLATLADPGERARQALWLAPLPPAQAGRTYGALFAELRGEGVTPLGLYRLPQAHLELPFAFAAPPPWMVLQPHDAAYVLAPPAWAAASIAEYKDAVRSRAAVALQRAWRRRRAAAAKR